MIGWQLVSILFVSVLSSDISFDDYKHKYGKYYSEDEEYYRMKLFKDNVLAVINHNERDSWSLIREGSTRSWKLGVNHLSDLSPEEFRKMLGKKINFRGLHREEARHIPLADLPNEIDWREKAVLTPVKNQGMCGSCWAFSAVEGVESHYAISRKKIASFPKLMELSEQQILDCTVIRGGGGCEGGFEQAAYKTIMEVGIASEWTYPYMSFFGDKYQCNATRSTPLIKISGYKNIPRNDYDGLVTALLTVGPIEVGVDASTWSSYESGIFDGCNKTHVEINHAVQLVGIGKLSVAESRKLTGKDSEIEYWIVRNSWGVEWGEQGYIRLLKQKNFTCGDQEGFKICGTCGILFDGNYPVI